MIQFRLHDGIIKIHHVLSLLGRNCVLQVTDTPDSAPPTPTESGEGIVGALMMVMQKRSKVIHSSGTCYNILLVISRKLFQGVQ